MTKLGKWALTLLRLGLGSVFFYAGITKVIDVDWSASGFLSSALTFPEFYDWLALSQNIGWVNELNQWGLTLIGASLILGIFVRFSSFSGIIIMLMYYFPGLEFPYVEHSYLVDNHIIYALSLFVLIATNAGTYFGVDYFWPWNIRKRAEAKINKINY